MPDPSERLLPPHPPRRRTTQTSTVSREVQTMSQARVRESEMQGSKEPSNEGTDDGPQTPRKRLRPDNTSPSTPPRNDSTVSAPRTPHAAAKLVVAFESPKGPKIAHINTDEYVAQVNDIVTEPWVPPEMNTYLYKFVNYNNPDDIRMPIHRVPAALHWTVVDEDPRFMQVTHLNRPLLMWVLGALVDASLVTTRTFPTPRVRVVMDFLRERDREAAIALYNKAASTTISRMETFVATTPTNDNEGPPSQEEIYDARECFQAKSKMLTVPQARLFSGDLVLAECTLVRCEQTTSKKVTYVLNSLHWLAEKPKTARATPLHMEPSFTQVFAYS